MKTTLNCLLENKAKLLSNLIKYRQRIPNSVLLAKTHHEKFFCLLELMAKDMAANPLLQKSKLKLSEIGIKGETEFFEYLAQAQEFTHLLEVQTRLFN